MGNPIEDRMGNWRWTVTCLAAGQQGAYRDTIYTHRVFIEHIPYSTRKEDQKWEPVEWSDEILYNRFKAIQFWHDKDKMPHPFAPYLDSFKRLGPGLFEFTVRMQYDD